MMWKCPFVRLKYLSDALLECPLRQTTGFDIRTGGNDIQWYFFEPVQAKNFKMSHLSLITVRSPKKKLFPGRSWPKVCTMFWYWISSFFKATTNWIYIWGLQSGSLKMSLQMHEGGRMDRLYFWAPGLGPSLRQCHETSQIFTGTERIFASGDRGDVIF